MFTKFTLQSILVLCIVLLLATAMVGSAVTAKEVASAEPIFSAPPALNLQQLSPVPGGPGYISVMGGTFTPTDDTIRWNVNAGELSNPDSEIDGSYIASVSLPQGAIVKQLVVFYNDLREDDLIVELRRKANNEFFQNLATVASQGATGYGFTINNTINQNFKTIDNQSYAYALTAYIPKKIGTT